MSNNKQQTAVEWLAKSYVDLLTKLNNEEISLKEFEIQYIEILEQAKEMEKERMIQFAKQCLDKALDLDVRTAYLQVEKYYNTTYGGNK
jgi:hypothetical protein